MEENVNFDNEVLAYLTIRKDQLIESHKHYIQGHPEIREVLNDFLSAVLLHKPNDVFVFAKEYFHPFNPTPLKYKPLIVVGPSGVGKNTLRSKILEKYGGLFEPKVSYTTRPGKAIEKRKENYYFITKEEFMKVSNVDDLMSVSLCVASGEAGVRGVWRDQWTYVWDDVCRAGEDQVKRKDTPHRGRCQGSHQDQREGYRRQLPVHLPAFLRGASQPPRAAPRDRGGVQAAHLERLERDPAREQLRAVH